MTFSDKIFFKCTNCNNLVRIGGYTDKKKEEVLDMRCKKLGVLLAMVLVGVSAAPAWSVSAAEPQALCRQG